MGRLPLLSYAGGLAAPSGEVAQGVDSGARTGGVVGSAGSSDLQRAPGHIEAPARDAGSIGLESAPAREAPSMLDGSDEPKGKGAEPRGKGAAPQRTQSEKKARGSGEGGRVSAASLKVHRRAVSRLQDHLVEAPCCTPAQLDATCELLTGPDLEDVVEERASNGVCGFAICSNELDPDQPLFEDSAPRRKIVAKENAVYDAKVLAQFCSSKCMKASLRYTARMPKEREEILEVKQLARILAACGCMPQAMAAPPAPQPQPQQDSAVQRKTGPAEHQVSSGKEAVVEGRNTAAHESGAAAQQQEAARKGHAAQQDAASLQGAGAVGDPALLKEGGQKQPGGGQGGDAAFGLEVGAGKNQAEAGEGGKGAPGKDQEGAGKGEKKKVRWKDEAKEGQHQARSATSRSTAQTSSTQSRILGSVMEKFQDPAEVLSGEPEGVLRGEGRGRVGGRTGRFALDAIEGYVPIKRDVVLQPQRPADRSRAGIATASKRPGEKQELATHSDSANRGARVEDPAASAGDLVAGVPCGGDGAGRQHGLGVGSAGSAEPSGAGDQRLKGVSPRQGVVMQGVGTGGSVGPFGPDGPRLKAVAPRQGVVMLSDAEMLGASRRGKPGQPSRSGGAVIAVNWTVEEQGAKGGGVTSADQLGSSARSQVEGVALKVAREEGVAAGDSTGGGMEAMASEDGLETSGAKALKQRSGARLEGQNGAGDMLGAEKKEGGEQAPGGREREEEQASERPRGGGVREEHHVVEELDRNGGGSSGRNGAEQGGGAGEEEEEAEEEEEEEWEEGGERGPSMEHFWKDPCTWLEDDEDEAVTMEFSPSESVVMALQHWVCADTILFLQGPKGPALGPSSTASRTLIGSDGWEYGRRVMADPERSGGIERTVAQCILRTLPVVLRQFAVRLPIATVELTMRDLVHTFSFVLPVPSFTRTQWHFLAALFLHALSKNVLPDIAGHFEDEDQRRRLEQVAEEAVESFEVYVTLFQFLLPSLNMREERSREDIVINEMLRMCKIVGD